MNKYIAAIVGIGVILAAIYLGYLKTNFSSAPRETASTTTPTSEKPLNVSLNLPTPSLEIPSLAGAGIAAQAWGNFEDYIKAAKAHDLPGVKSLSYQLSPTCSDPNKLQECYQLMDSAVFFTKDFKQTDFKNVAYDDKQVVMSTDYFRVATDTPFTQLSILFVRASSTPKILSVKFCYSMDEKNEKPCVNTDPATRDQNKNGWWDDVEAFFRTATSTVR